MENELQIFNYQQLDEVTAKFLKEKETNMREIAGKAETEFGRELYAAQQELSKKGSKYNGVFEKWYTYMGWKKQTIYNLINRYNLVQKLDIDSEKNLFESLPKTLSYEVAKPSANEKVKQKVFDGEVKTLKEYKEMEKALKKIEEEKAELGQLLTQERNKPPVIETKTIEKEIDNTDYDKINQLQRELEQNKNKLKNIESQKSSLEQQIKLDEEDASEYRKLKDEIKRLHSQKDDLHRQIESATSLSALYAEIEHLLQNKLAPVKYSKALTERRDSKVAMRNLKDIINTVEDWLEEMKSYLPKENINIIDAEVIEYE